MKFSLNSIRALVEREKTSDDVTAMGADQLIERIGAQLGAIDEIERLGEKYHGLIIAKVVSLEPHPNADKLSVCQIDDGGAAKNVSRTKGLVSVVCGAPNVASGQTVVWLPPGTIVPETFSREHLKLESRDIRGVISNGMIASARELAISDSHAGILTLEGDLKPGSDFADTFNLSDDVVVDIENKMFTHRPDCFGWLGIARELAGIQGLTFKSPTWYTSQPEEFQPGSNLLKLKVKNELPKLVPRFLALPISGLKVAESPLWLQIELSKAGIRPINNVVDVTNYVMLVTAQPLHAYDYDKLAALSRHEPSLVIRHPHKGETVELIGAKTIAPKPDTIMIATDQELIGVGGIMGGAATEVSPQTKNIVLECANFDMFATRRASMQEGLFSDANTRFTKAQSPLQNPAAMRLAVQLIHQYCGGELAGQFVDDNQLSEAVRKRANLYPAVKTSAAFINARLGLNLSAADISQLLTNVEFSVVHDDSHLTVEAPFWRTDIEYPEDVVEEVGRLFGYDRLPLKLPSRSLQPAQRSQLLDAKATVRAALAKGGANEVLSYSFVSGKLLRDVGQDPKKAFRIANALSPDLEYYRLSLMPSLLNKVSSNLKAGFDQFALFEIGKTNSLENGQDEDGLPKEFELTALVLAANNKLNFSQAAFYQAKRYLSEAAGSDLEFKPLPASMRSFAIVQPYNPERLALVNLRSSQQFLGIIGEFRAEVSNALKLPRYCAGFEVDTTVLASARQTGQAYQPLTRFPKLTQDLTLQVKTSQDYQSVAKVLEHQLDRQLGEDFAYSLIPLGIYQAKSDSDHKNITWRLEVASYERTLTDQEINQLLDNLVSAAKKQLTVNRV